jgi:hypothetical protein
MKRLVAQALLPLALLVAALTFSIPAHAQTFNLPSGNVKVDFIDYGTYSNLFYPDIPITINGVSFYVNIALHTMPDFTIDASSSAITFENLVTDTSISVPVTGTISSYKYTIGQVGPVINGAFTGAYSGGFTLNLEPYHPCKIGRWCYLIYWNDPNSTLTLTATP